MFGAGAVTVGILVVVAVSAALVLNRRRANRLQRELDQVYEAQHILQRAHDRKHRNHLHLLVAVPLAWIAGRLTSSSARLAVATGVSVGVTGGLIAVNPNEQPVIPPPAGAETTVPHSPDGNDWVSSATSIPPSLSSTNSPAADSPPVSAPAPGSGSAPTDAAPSVEAPTLDPTTTTTTLLPELPVTTSTTIELPAVEILPCLNPQGVQLPVEACP